MAIFGQNGQNSGKYRENPVFRGFGAFWAFSGPSAQGFYINPWLGGPGPPGAWDRPPGLLRSSEGSGTPPRGSRDPGIRRSQGTPSPGGAPSGVPEPGPGVPGSPGGRGFTSTPRAGAPRFPGRGPGDLVPGGVPGSPGRGPGGPWADHPRPGEPRGPALQSAGGAPIGAGGLPLGSRARELWRPRGRRGFLLKRF